MQVFRAEDFRKSDDFFKVLMNTDRSQVAMMVLQNGDKSGPLATDHPKSDQLAYVLEGEGQLVLHGEDIHLLPGDAVLVPAGLKHQFVGTSDHPFRTLNVYSPVAYPDEVPETPEAASKDAVSFDAEQR